MSPEERNDSPEVQLLSRRLFIGLGKYGGVVAQHIRSQHEGEPPESNQLTQVLAFQQGQPPFELPADSSRRSIRQQLLKSEVFGEVFRQIDHAVSQCARMPRVADDAPNVDPCVCVFIVADLAEPFAGGVLLDVARLAGVATWGRLRSIVGVLGLGLFLGGRADDDFVERRTGYCNVCAALREVDYAQSKGLGNEFKYSDPVPDVPASKAFDQCFLVTESNRRGTLGDLDEHAQFLTRFLFHFCRDDFLRKLIEFPKQVRNPGQAPKRPLYSSAGLASVFFPRVEAHAFCMEHWARDIADAISREQPPQAPDAVAAYEESRSVFCDSYQSLAERISHRVIGLPDASIPGGKPDTLREAAEIFLDVLDEMERVSSHSELPLEAAEFARQKYVEPFRTKCRFQIDRLLEKSPSGLGLARACLDQFFRPDFSGDAEEAEPWLNQLLTVSSGQVASAREGVEGTLQRYRRRLRQILDSPADRPVPPRPFWLLHPFQYLRTIREEKKLEFRLDAWHHDLATLCSRIQKNRVALASHRVLEMLAEVVQSERQQLQKLLGELGRTAVAIGQKHRAGAPQRLGVDRALIPENCYEAIYAECITEAGSIDIHDALRKLVVEDRFLAGFRTATAAQLAGAIEQAGCRFFDRVKDMDIDSILEDHRYSRYIHQCDDILAGAWEKAEPLVDITGAVLPDGWSIGQLSALWLPDPNHLQTYGPSLAAMGQYLHLNTGSATSIDLCRVIHGFTLDSLDLLRVYVSSYNLNDRKTDLHICDWIDDLPSLPEPKHTSLSPGTPNNSGSTSDRG